MINFACTAHDGADVYQASTIYNERMPMHHVHRLPSGSESMPNQRANHMCCSHIAPADLQSAVQSAEGLAKGRSADIYHQCRAEWQAAKFLQSLHGASAHWSSASATAMSNIRG